ncbi:MAG: hypothetical protein H8D94_00505 [Candidatus Pelagibacter sp.]|nr:hypothetical protein [Candidatus Pelagibacter sp.]
MKYKIIPNDIVKNMIEFLDEVQFDAAKDSSPDALHKINFCNWMISELMNGLDGFDSEDEANKEAGIEPDSGDTMDRWDIIDNYRNNKDLRKDFPDDMSDDEWYKLIQNFDNFIDSWDKEYKKSNHKNKAKQNSLKKFLQELKIDNDLTPEEKFELYYDEYSSRKKEKESASLKQLLNRAGVKKRFDSKDK